LDQAWLEDVLILLEEGSLAAAAKRRHITQPAFSRRIRAFEQWLGQPILERGANKVRIAPILRHNEAELRALQSRIHELRSQLKHYDPTITTITLAAQHSAVLTTFAQMSLAARQAMPNLRFKLQAANQNDCLSMFVRGDADILMFYQTTDARPYGFDHSVAEMTLKSDQLVLMAGRALASKVDKNNRLTADTPAIVFPTNSYFGNLLSRFGKPFSTRELTANPTVDSAFTMGIKDWVQQDIGVAWLPLSLTEQAIKSGDLINLSASGGLYSPIDLKVVLYWRTTNPTVQALVDVWHG